MPISRNVTIEYLRLLGEELTEILDTFQVLNEQVLTIGRVELRRFIIKSTFISRCMDDLIVTYGTSVSYNYNLHMAYERFRAEFMRILYEVIYENTSRRQIRNVILIRFITRVSIMRHSVLNEINRLS